MGWGRPALIRRDEREEAIDMRALMALWLTRLQAGLIRGMTEIDLRALELFLPAPSFVERRKNQEVTRGSAEPRHDPLDRAVPGLWLWAPRVAVALWSARQVAALTSRSRPVRPVRIGR
ncbi:hypothetical protein ACVBEQ_14960 [Nakamurella sp. GG22]